MRTLAYDLPGHGASQAVPDAGSPRKAAQAIAADMAARGLPRVHLVGHSMGGAIAALTALAAPERIASLTLLAPGGIGPEIDAPLLRRYAEAADEAELAACLAAMSGPDAATPAGTIEVLLAMRRRPGQIDRLETIAMAPRSLRRCRCCGERRIRSCPYPRPTPCRRISPSAALPAPAIC